MRTHEERVVEALTDLTGLAWKVRRGRLVATTLPGGRLFYAAQEHSGSRWWAYTAAGLGSHGRRNDGRVVGCADVEVRPGERVEEVAAMHVAALRERALDDPRNAGRDWPTATTPGETSSALARFRAEVEARRAATRYLEMRAARSATEGAE